MTTKHSCLNKPASRSKYDLLLPPGIKRLIMKETRIQLFNQNCLSQLNLILVFSQFPLCCADSS